MIESGLISAGRAAEQFSLNKPNGRPVPRLLRKRLATENRGVRLREEYRYFFFITNDREMPADQVVLTAGGRCDQENLVAPAQKGRARPDHPPVDNLVGNWAYMVMASWLGA